MYKLGLWAMMFMAAIWVFSGCGEKEQDQSKPATVTKEEVKQEVKEAYKAAAIYTKEQMQTYKDEAEAKLAGYAKDIDQLKVKAEKLEGDARVKAEQQITALRQKRDAVSEKLKELSSSSGSAWEQLKSGLDAAMDDLIDAYKKVVAEFSNS